MGHPYQTSSTKQNKNFGSHDVHLGLFCSTTLLIASTRRVWSTFSSHCQLSSKQCLWLTQAKLTIVPLQVCKPLYHPDPLAFFLLSNKLINRNGRGDSASGIAKALCPSGPGLNPGTHFGFFRSDCHSIIAVHWAFSINEVTDQRMSNTSILLSCFLSWLKIVIQL